MTHEIMFLGKKKIREATKGGRRKEGKGRRVSFQDPKLWSVLSEQRSRAGHHPFDLGYHPNHAPLSPS